MSGDAEREEFYDGLWETVLEDFMVVYEEFKAKHVVSHPHVQRLLKGSHGTARSEQSSIASDHSSTRLSAAIPESTESSPEMEGSTTEPSNPTPVERETRPSCCIIL